MPRSVRSLPRRSALSSVILLTVVVAAIGLGAAADELLGWMGGDAGVVLVAAIVAMLLATAAWIEWVSREQRGRAAQLEATNRELRESEERYRRLVELSPETIILSRGGQLLFVNPAGVALLGARSTAEIVGRPMLDIVPENERCEVLARATACELDTRPAPLAERTIRRLDGALLETEATSTPCVLDGLPTVLTVIRDVTERRRAEAALREIEARYRHVVMNVPGVVYQLVYGADGGFGFTLVSGGVRELFGVEPDVVLRDPARLLGLLHAEDRDGFNAACARAVTTLAPWRWEGRFVLASGEEKWVQLAAHQVRQDDGSVRSDGFLLDVTARRLAARRLEESELRFHLAARATRDIVYDWNITSDTLFWGDTLSSAFGYGRREIEANNAWWIARIHPEDVESVLDSLDDALGGSAESWSAEYRFRCHDGSYASVLDRAYLVRDENGAATRLVGSMSDLTERKGLEEQLRQSQKMEAVGQLAGGVAHDFNNILTAVTSYSDLLLSDTEESDPRRDWVLEIRKGANRAAALTRQLLAFSRRQMLQPRALDLNATVRDIERMLRRLLVEDVTLAVALDPALGVVRADPGQVEQVLVNLAVNARDAMPEGGSLTIETTNVELAEPQTDARRQVTIPPGRYIRVAVSDTGCGMDEATMAHIFEPFFTTKEPGKGTGLGLSTVYGIVKQSGGFIRCYSERGTGTVFKVYLPRVDAVVEPERARTPARAPEAAAAPVGRGSETILLVEDDESVRAVTREILTKQGYHVLEAGNGAEAVEICARAPASIDLVVSDMVMPELSGPELGRLIRARHPGIAVLLMSGYTRDAALRQSFLDDDTEFIEKPFTPRELVARVREVLGARGARAARATPSRQGAPSPA